MAQVSPGFTQADSEHRVFVTKMGPQITQQDVAEHFAQFGTTTDVYLPGIPGRPGHKGIAFVSFTDAAAVQAATSVSPHMINGSEVVVDIAYSREQKRQEAVAVPVPARGGRFGDRLFVTRVPATLNKEHLELHFAQFGELSDCYMPSIPGSGTHKGIAFISYVNPTSVQAAFQHPSHEINGIPVVVDIAFARGGKGAQAPAGPQESRSAEQSPFVPGRLFLTKVPQEVTKADLEVYFRQFGELADVYVHGKGIAFVHLKDPVASQQILLNKEHFVKPGVSVLVDQALARPSGSEKGGKGLGPMPMPMAQPTFTTFSGNFGMMDPNFQVYQQAASSGLTRFNPY